MAFGIGMQPVTGLANGAALADTAQHILQGPARRIMGMHIVGRHQAQTQLAGQYSEPVKARLVVSVIQVRRC